jgi:hypothetical protein
MHTVLQKLFQMFYPLSHAEQQRWAEILSRPEPEYISALGDEARNRGLSQSVVDGAVAWLGEGNRQLVLFFRILNPRDLEALRKVYEVIAANEAPLAYTFVHQIPDGEGTWDIFHMSKLTYLAHCNRVSGPGSECEK